jgi:hypothetical protein
MKKYLLIAWLCDNESCQILENLKIHIFNQNAISVDNEILEKLNRLQWKYNSLQLLCS